MCVSKGGMSASVQCDISERDKTPHNVETAGQTYAKITLRVQSSSGGWFALDILEEGRVIGIASIFKMSAGDAFNGFNREYLGTAFDCCSAVFNDLKSDFNQNVYRLFNQNVGLGFNVLVLNRLTIARSCQGRGIGLVALLMMMQLWGKDCALALIKPFPLQYEGEDCEGDPKKFQQSCEKLVKYYSRLGFKRIPETEYLAFSFAYPLPTLGIRSS